MMKSKTGSTRPLIEGFAKLIVIAIMILVVGLFLLKMLVPPGSTALRNIALDLDNFCATSETDEPSKTITQPIPDFSGTGTGTRYYYIYITEKDRVPMLELQSSKSNYASNQVPNPVLQKGKKPDSAREGLPKLLKKCEGYEICATIGSEIVCNNIRFETNTGEEEANLVLVKQTDKITISDYYVSG